MEKRREIPWPHIFAEGVAIVFSILLAFWIQAWWDERQDSSEEHRFLVALKSEIEQNLEIVEREINYSRAVIASIMQLFDGASGQSDLTPESVDKLIGDMTWWGHGIFVTAATQSVDLSKIEDFELRQLLAEITNAYQKSTRSQFQDEDWAKNVIVPYLSTRASFPQIANTMSEGRPGTGQIPMPPIYPVSERRNHAPLLDDDEFLTFLVWEHGIHEEMILDYQSVQQKIDHALVIINQELTD